MKTSWASMVKTPVGSNSHPSFPEKPSLAANAIVEKREVEWLVAGGKRQTAGPQSPEAPETKATDRPTPFTNVKGDAFALKANITA